MSSVGRMVRCPVSEAPGTLDGLPGAKPLVEPWPGRRVYPNQTDVE